MPANIPVHHRLALWGAALCLWLSLSGCGRPKEAVPDHANAGSDAILREVMAYRAATRAAYNSQRFDELDQRADEARAGKARFGNGSWQIAQFYDALALADTDSESLWQLHDAIGQAWIAARPDSVTARVARIHDLAASAWHARGSGYANTVTPEGGRLFEERLKAAHAALDESQALAAGCPGWWTAGLKIALGEGWERAEYDRFVAAAKAQEPEFWGCEAMRSNFLAVKWYGEPGEWEAAAAEPTGPGAEIYTRCVLVQLPNYRNVFKESRATWAKTQEGFELMRARYPDSMEIASGYCRLACVAGDRPTAKRLFGELGDRTFSYLWVNRENLRRDRAWAEGK